MMPTEQCRDFRGMLVMDAADREFAEWLLHKAGADAIERAVKEQIDAGGRPFPSAIAKSLALFKKDMRLEQAGRAPTKAPSSDLPVPPKGGIWRTFRSDGLRLAVNFAYSPVYHGWWRQALLESAVPAYFQGKVKLWVLPLNSLSRVLDALSPHEAYFRRDVADRLAREAKERAAPMAGEWLGVRISQGLFPSRQVATVVESGYDPILNDAIRSTNAATWVSSSKAWMLDLSAQRTLEVLQQAGIDRESITITDDVLEILAQDNGGSDLPAIDLGPLAEIKPGEHAGDAGVSGALMATIRPLRKMPIATERLAAAVSVHDLLPHQVTGAEHILGRSSSLLADDMGLGKTRQAIVACIVDGRPTMVLCPPTLKANWKAEIADRGIPLESIQVLDGGIAVDHSKSWWIANFEIAKSCADVPFFNLIIDEAHYLKEPSSQRTKDAFRLSAKASRVALLTATPVLNREEEIWTLLRLGGHPLGQIELREFRKMHAGSSEARQDLRKRIDEWMLRRMKLGNISIPGKRRIEPRFTPSAEAMEEYAAIFRNNKLQAMEKMWRLQVWLEKTKRPLIVDTLRGLQKDAKAIVFSQYLETVDWYMDQLGAPAVRLTGAESLKARRSAQQAFQEDASVRYFITTFKAGGVGITLTAASYVLMTSRPWTPAEMEQAEDRANRIGQKSLVQIIVPTIPGTIDEQIARVISDKLEITSDILQTSAA